MKDLNELNKRPQEATELDEVKKGIKLFFGEKEDKFFDFVGREITNEILQESFILYRMDLQKTKTHSLYGESKFKQYKTPVEIFGRLNVEANAPEFMVKGGLVKKGMGLFTAHVYLSHLKELNLLEEDPNSVQPDIRMGDFIYYKNQFYKIIDDGYSNISNEFSYASDRRFYITIKAVEVDEDIFKAR